MELSFKDVMLDILVDMLKYDEGVELKPYTDTSGHTTIGIGRNLDSVGISRCEADMMLMNDINVAHIEIIKIVKNFDQLDNVRQSVLLNMVFNLGSTRFRKFRNMIAAVHDFNFDMAADEMLDSLWAKQVKSRSLRLSECMRLGKNAYKDL